MLENPPMWLKYKYYLLGGVLLLSSCTRIVPVSDVTTTKSSADTTRTQVSVNIPASNVKVTLNIDSLVGAAKSQGKEIVVKGASGRSSYDIGIRPNGTASVDCHCADTTLKYMQEVIRLMVDRDRTVVKKEEPSAFGQLVKDFQRNLFWVMVVVIVLGGVYAVKRFA